MVNGSASVIPASAPAAFGATTFDGGEISEHLRQGKLPGAARVADPFGYASGALSWDLEVPGGEAREVGDRGSVPSANAGPDGANFAAALAAVPPRLARAPRPRRAPPAARRGPARPHLPHRHRPHPDQSRRPRHPAGLPLLRPHLDPRRLAHLLGPAARRPRGRGPGAHRVVRALPVPQRQGPLLRGRPRRRSRAGERQPRRVHLPGGRVLALHRRHAPRWRRSGRTSRRPSPTSTSCAAAPHGRVPPAREAPAISASSRNRSATRATRPTPSTPTGTTSSPSRD